MFSSGLLKHISANPMLPITKTIANVQLKKTRRTKHGITNTLRQEHRDDFVGGQIARKTKNKLKTAVAKENANEHQNAQLNVSLVERKKIVRMAAIPVFRTNQVLDMAYLISAILFANSIDSKRSLRL